MNSKKPGFILAVSSGSILVPSGKIINFVFPFPINEDTDLFMTLIELKPLFLLMKINPSLLKYLEKIGMFLSSSFKINTDPLKSAVKKKFPMLIGDYL